MKIGVLLKQTPDTETKIKLKPDAGGVEESDIKWVINPYDEYGVEEALRLKEAAGGGEVVILTVGPQKAAEAMRQALAMGADRGIRVDTEGVALDHLMAARALAKVAAEENLDVLFAGKQAVDDDLVLVAHAVATHLGWPCVWPAEKMALESDKKTVTAVRPVAGGVKEVLEVTLPGVFCCDKGEHDPRYASLPGIMKAKSKPIKEVKAKELLGGDAKPAVTYANFALPAEERKGKIIQGEPEQACAELVRLLREEAKVI